MSKRIDPFHRNYTKLTIERDKERSKLSVRVGTSSVSPEIKSGKFPYV